MTFTVDISTRGGEWAPLQATIEKAALMALKESSATPPAELSIVLADDVFVQKLNKEYRGKDKPTNVLSFPAGEPGMLGDVILGYETVAREAAEQGKSLEHHVIHLIIHGILHLIGHDHESDTEAEVMESIEIRILQSFGVKNPYE